MNAKAFRKINSLVGNGEKKITLSYQVYLVRCSLKMFIAVLLFYS